MKTDRGYYNKEFQAPSETKPRKQWKGLRPGRKCVSYHHECILKLFTALCVRAHFCLCSQHTKSEPRFIRICHEITTFSFILWPSNKKMDQTRCHAKVSVTSLETLWPRMCMQPPHKVWNQLSICHEITTVRFTQCAVN